MIVDSSAVVAIIRGEPDAAALVDLLRRYPSAISAANFVESAVVIDSRRDPALSNQFEELLRRTDTALAAVTPSQARIARQAYRDFGKGSGHRAQLNFGDCFAYALAVESDEPLLYKSSSGNDFGHTDVRSALQREP